MIGELALALEAIAPSRLAADWDKVGLLVGDPARPLKRALLCIDLTEETLAEAVRLRCQAIVAYHPPIFEPITRLTAWEPRGALLMRCIKSASGSLSMAHGMWPCPCSRITSPTACRLLPSHSHSVSPAASWLSSSRWLRAKA